MSLLSDEDVRARLAHLPHWKRDGDALERTFECGTFDGALRFVNAVAVVANALDHHPDIALSWGSVRLRLNRAATVGIVDARGLEGTRAPRLLQLDRWN
jgi:4a-hydroxytetrahydrobiopterin dehydratase